MSDALKLAFAGDLLLGGEWPKHAQQRAIDLLAPFEKIMREIEAADLFFINLEGPISGTLLNQKSSRTARLANHPGVVGLLKRARTCVCVLANNHITDAGSEGVTQTRALLESEGIFCVGAGSNAAEAERPIIVECKGKRIGCLAFVSNDQDVSAVIANNGAGCAGLCNVERVESAIKALKSKCDVVVVSVHWGIEFFQYPTADQVALADRFAKAGADYIMGHHPHVLQGVEERSGCLAIYSLGHFFVPPFRRADGELIRPKGESREFAIVKANVGECPGFEVVGGWMDSDFVLQPYDLSRRQTLKRKLEQMAPSRMTGNYSEFSKQYYSARLKELSRERKMETIAGFIREPVKEIKRRFASRTSPQTCSV